MAMNVAGLVTLQEDDATWFGWAPVVIAQFLPLVHDSSRRYGRPSMKSSTVLLGAVTLLATACPTMITVDGISVPQARWVEAEAAVSQRAKSDLDCEDVKLKLLKI